MPKGNRCPACGELTFHNSKQYKAVYECSSCRVVGWWESPGSAGSGKGSTCASCNGNTMRTVYEGTGVAIRFCSTCKATMLSPKG